MAKLTDIHNYYEELVRNYIDALELQKDDDYVSDLYCLALNRLPAYYIRYGVDMHFYTSDAKQQEMEDKVVDAVNAAINWLENGNDRRVREQL